MPKKIFNSNISTVLIKLKRNSLTARKKSIERKPSKLILVDGNNERKWKLLKAESGHKTDALFIEYLLKLAHEDLGPNRRNKCVAFEETRVGGNRFTSKNEVIFQRATFCPCDNSDSNNRNKCITGNNKQPHNEDLSNNSTATNKTNHCDDTLAVDNQILISSKKVQKIGKEEKASTELMKKLKTAKKGGAKNKKTRRNEIVSSLKESRARGFLRTCAVELNYITSRQPEENNFNASLLQQVDKIAVPKDGVVDDASKIAEAINGCSAWTTSTTSSSFAQPYSPCTTLTTVSCSRIHDRSLYEEKLPTRTADREDFAGRSEEEIVKGSNDRQKLSSNLVGSGGHVSAANKKYKRERNDKLQTKLENESNGSGAKMGLRPFRKSRHLSNECSARTQDLENCDQTPVTAVYDFSESDSGDWCVDDRKRDDSDCDSTSPMHGLSKGKDFDQNSGLAKKSLPESLILKVVDEVHGLSVFAQTFLPKSSQFGPILGETIREMDISDDLNMKDIWEVNTRDGLRYICTRDTETSNWLKYLRPAPSRDVANMTAFSRNSELFFVTTKDVLYGEELVYWVDNAHSPWSKKKLEKKNCGGCNIHFTHPLYYRKHCTIFHDPSSSLTIRKYHCKVCGLAVMGKEKIMKHAADMHQGKGAYQCQYCHKFFLRLNYLEMHRTYGCAKNPQRSRPLCDLCGRKFCQPQKLKVHIKRMHSDMAQVLKEFQCKNCLKILGSRAALQRHMKEVHSKDIVGACTCDRCGKMFQNKSNLKIHMLTHSGVKPFRCRQEECTAAFTTKQCLQFHYKKVHGFAEGLIPKIERSVAYTFDAYSGGAVSKLLADDQVTRGSLSDERDSGLDLTLVLSHGSCQEKKQADVEVGGEAPQATIIIKKEEQEALCDEGKPSRMVASKGSKKWMGASDFENDELRLKSVFRHENPNASLLVEAAINAAERDIADLSESADGAVADEVDRARNEPGYSPVGPGASDESQRCVSLSPGALNDSNDYRPESYEKLSDSPNGRECEKPLSEQGKYHLPEFFKCGTLVRASSGSFLEMPKDYNISTIIKDHDAESFTEIDVHDYRNRELLGAYKETESFHEIYKNQENYRSDKVDVYRNSDPDKIEYRDIDLCTDYCRNLASNLEKYRTCDNYRPRETFEAEGHQDTSEELERVREQAQEQEQEHEGEVQNLCLKEKSLQVDLTYKQYETLEELARIGRDNPGFECLLVSENNGQANQSPGVTMSRSMHGILSPRSYHPVSYDSESVDLSLPRTSYTSPPVYTLDLTPGRMDLTSARHFDLRNHLGFSSHRFSNSRIPVAGSASGPLSPNGYNIYPHIYGSAPTRLSPTAQFQPYTSLYY